MEIPRLPGQPGVSALLDNVETWSGKGRADENFPVGSVLVSARLRPHVHAFYNFARNADDIADSPDLAPQDKIVRLDVMEAVLTGQHEAGSPSATALRASLAQTRTTDRHARDLLVAFRQDATKQRYATWEELVEYCRYSAMPVGRHVLDLHGEAEATHAPSDGLCAALQVLNHLQDGKKDLAALDRCYLPQDMLRQNGAITAELAGAAETPGLRAVFTDMLDRCEAWTVAAIELPRKTQDRRLRLETATIVGLAGRLARLLRNHDPVAGRVKLRRADAVLSVLAALRFAP